MRSDWNRRAAEDAYYYAAFTRRKQADGEFFQSASAVLAWLESELRRLDPATGRQRALEIGCGPARLMRPMSAHFAEIHGVDVSDEMVRIAKRNLAGLPNAFVQRTTGTDLEPFPDEYFDFVYSYAVFQHIPRREVVMAYLREAWRVLKTGAILTCHLNGLPQHEQGGTTWDGARVSAAEVATLARELDCQLLAMEHPLSQYMWTTWRKRDRGRKQFAVANVPAPTIRAIWTGAAQSATIPAGRETPVCVLIENLPADCGLQDLSATAGGREARLSRISPRIGDGAVEVKIVVPPLRQAGLTPLVLCLRGMPISPAQSIEVTAASGDQPIMVSLADGVNAFSGLRIVSRFVKARVKNLLEPNQLSASVDGIPARRLKPYCVDQQTQEFDINYVLPQTAGAGAHRFELFYRSNLLVAARIHLGLLRSLDVFDGAPVGARLLDVDAASGGAGNAALATAFTVSAGGRLQAGEAVYVDAACLPFQPGSFDGIACRLDAEPPAWDGFCAGMRRVLNAQGALYLELPHLRNAKPAELASVLELGVGLPFRWQRPLGRSMAPRSRPGRRAARALEYARAALSLGLRAMDRFGGTRLAVAGMGFYFGHIWRESAHKAMLNACARCGRAHSSGQLQAAGALRPLLIIVAYACPACGCHNFFTIDR